MPGKSPLQILLAQTKRAEVMDFLIRLNDKMPKVKKQGPSQVFNSQRMFAMPTSTDSGMKPISAVHAMVRQSTAKMLHAREKLIYRESATIEQDFSGTASSSEGEKYLAGLIRQKNIAFMSKLDAEINRLTGCNDALSMQKKALFEKLYDIVESNPYVHPRQNTMKWFNDPTVRRIAKGYDQSSDGNPMHVIRQLRPGRFFSWGQLFGWDTSTAHAIIKEYALTAFHGEFQQTYQPVADANGIFPPQYSEDSQRSSSFSQATTLSDSDSGSTSSGPLTGRGFPEPSAPPYDPRYPTI